MNQQRSWWQKSLRPLGWALTAASLVFVLLRLLSSRPWELEALHQRETLLSLAILALVASVMYGGATLLLADAWRVLASIAGPIPARRALYSVYARTQIMRYVPGNIAHLASRHVESRKLGLRHAQLLWASSAELAATLLGAVLIASFGLGSLFEVIGSQDFAAEIPGAGLTERLVLGLSIAIVLLLLPVLGLVVAKGTRWGERLPDGLTIGRALSLGGLVLARCFAFFAVTGIITVLLTRAVAPDFVGSSYLLISVSAVAWAFGFITPGAPAGLGVREASLTLLLTPLLGPASATTVAVLSRVITMAGDVLLFLASFPLGAFEDQEPSSLE